MMADLTWCPVCGVRHRSDTWVFPTVMNARCFAVRKRAEEQSGHRGHPTETEIQRAIRVAERLGALVIAMKAEGMAESEAVTFIAGVAYQAASEAGETWHDLQGCKLTIHRLLYGGGAAKSWSMTAIEMAISSIWEVIE